MVEAITSVDFIHYDDDREDDDPVRSEFRALRSDLEASEETVAKALDDFIWLVDRALSQLRKATR
jgi:hypothetical protein